MLTSININKKHGVEVFANDFFEEYKDRPNDLNPVKLCENGEASPIDFDGKNEVLDCSENFMQQFPLNQRVIHENKCKQRCRQIANQNQDTDALLDALIKMIQDAASNGLTVKYIDAQINIECPPTWSFMNSLYFSSTIMTSVGYGSRSPATTKGQAIVYGPKN